MARNASWVAFVQIAAGSAIMGAMSVNLKTPQEIEMMRIAGRLASEVLDIVTPTSSPVSPPELDRICHDHIVNVQGAIPANVGYRGFPKTVCTSVNNVICHGIPSEGKVLGMATSSISMSPSSRTVGTATPAACTSSARRR